MPRFQSSRLAPRPIAQAQAIASAAVRSASDRAVVEETIGAVGSLQEALTGIDERLNVLENPEP